MAEIKDMRSGEISFFAALWILFVSGCGSFLQRDSVNLSSLESEAVRIIRDGLSDNDPRVRTNTIEVIASVGLTEFMPEVQRLLRDDFVPVRFAAALAVGDAAYQPAKSDIERLLKAPDENTKIAAAYAMAKLGFPMGLDFIRKAAVSKDQVVRANAVVLLGKSDDESALKLLSWAQTDKDSDDKVRFQAAEAIARLGDEKIFPKLWAIVLSSYADDRIMGIKAMGALGTEKAKDVLATKLDDEVLEVRLAAAEQLGMLGDKTGEREVLDVFKRNLAAGMDKQGVERINVLTALAIGRIGTSRLIIFLPSLLKNESKSVRLAAAKAVFQYIMRK